MLSHCLPIAECKNKKINTKFLFKQGERGVPGERGPAGPQGPKGTQGESGEVGVTYIRWGKKTCPNTGATLVYEGNNKTVFIIDSFLPIAVRNITYLKNMFSNLVDQNVILRVLNMFRLTCDLYDRSIEKLQNSTFCLFVGHVGGSYYSHKGGASNYVCLTRDPIYAKYESGYQDDRARIYGAEYQTFSTGIYPSSLFEHDVPCAVCHVTKRASQMMVPGRNVCPAGWTREYKGYLMAEYHSHYRTMYTCVDENPDYMRGTHSNLNGALFLFR